MAAEPPRKKSRPAGDGEDLKRAAEIVMVLSAMGEMRGGCGPSAVEKALVAEARELLASVCEAVKPKDLFSREAVRVLVEDLGLNRSKDPMMGFRPPKMSIAEKLQLTKKKMEVAKESKESAPHSSIYSSQFQPGGVSTNPETVNSLFHGTPKFPPDKPTQLSISAGGFQTATSVTFIPALASASSSVKPSQASSAHPAGASLRSSGSSVEKTSTSAAISRSEVTHFRLDPLSGGPTFITHVQDKSPTTAAHPTSVSTVRLGQANKLQDAAIVKTEGVHEVDAVQTSAMANQEPKTVSVQTLPGNLFMGNQPAGLTYVHPPSGFPNHNEIAKMVQKVLQQKASELSNLTPPSTDYMNKTLNCQICKITITDAESLLVCDACEKGTHLKCLQSYGNKGISKLEWHCPKCLASSNGKPLPPKYGRVTRALAVSKVSSSSGGTQASTETKTDISDSKINHQNAIGNSSSHASATGNNSLGSIEAKAETAGSKINHQNQSGNSASLVHASAAGCCPGSTEAKVETAYLKINHQNSNGNFGSLVHASAAGSSIGSMEAKPETADSKTNHQHVNGNSSLVCPSIADYSLCSTEANAETADSKINHQNSSGDSSSLVDALATVTSLNSLEARAETVDAKINHQNLSGNSLSLVHASATETKAESAGLKIIHQHRNVNSASLADASATANSSLGHLLPDTTLTNRKDMQDISSSANTKMEDRMHTGTCSGPSKEVAREVCVNQCLDSEHSITNINNSMLHQQNPSDESELHVKGKVSSYPPQEIDKPKNGEHPSGMMVIPCQSQAVGSQVEDKSDVGISVESSADPQRESKADIEKLKEPSDSMEPSKGT